MKRTNYFVFINFLILILTSILYFINKSYEQIVINDNINFSEYFQNIDDIKNNIPNIKMLSPYQYDLAYKFVINNLEPNQKFLSANKSIELANLLQSVNNVSGSASGSANGSASGTTSDIRSITKNNELPITPIIKYSEPKVYKSIPNQYPLNGFKIQDANNGYFLTVQNNKYIETNQIRIASEFNIIKDDLNIDKDCVGIQNLISGKYIKSDDNGNVLEDDFVPNNPYYSWIVQKTGKDMYVIYSKFHNKFICFDGNNIILSEKYNQWIMKIFPDIDINIINNEYFSNYETFELL